MRIPHDRDIGGAHAGPTLKRRMVLVRDRQHHFANVKGLLASGICVVRKDLADACEAVLVPLP